MRLNLDNPDLAVPAPRQACALISNSLGNAFLKACNLYTDNAPGEAQHSLHTLSSLINMHRRSRLSDDLRECIVKIHKHGIRVKQISEWTGISERTLYEVIQKYNRKRTVSTEALRNCERPRALDYVDTEVSCHSQSTCTLLYLLYSSCLAHWGTEMTYIWMN